MEKKSFKNCKKIQISIKMSKFMLANIPHLMLSSEIFPTNVNLKLYHIPILTTANKLKRLKVTKSKAGGAGLWLWCRLC